MRRFVRFVVFGWGSPSLLDEPPAAATVYARWQQWRRRGEWPGSFNRGFFEAFNAGWESAMATAQKRAGTDTAPPPAE